MIYLDTSALGALFFREPTAPAILQRLESLDGGKLCTSAWTLAEMASVGAIKERTGAIDATERAEGLDAFQRFVSGSLILIEVEPADFRVAALLLDTPRLALRAAEQPWRLWMSAKPSRLSITAWNSFPLFADVAMLKAALGRV